MVAVGLISTVAGAPGVRPSRNKSSDCAPATADLVKSGRLGRSSAASSTSPRRASASRSCALRSPSWYANAVAVLMLSTTASGLYLIRSWYRKLRWQTSSVRSLSRSWSISRRCSGFAMTEPRSRRARLAGRKTLPHSTSIVARPRCGSSARAVARTSSSNRATSTTRRGAAPSSRRATAWPTSPLPPRIITVRSRRSMQSLDGLDFVRGEPPKLALRQSSQPHWSVGHPVQPLDLEVQRLREPPHDALTAFREGDLDLDARVHGTHAEVHDAHRATVDRRRSREGRPHLSGPGPMDPQPIGAGHGEAWMHQPMRGGAVRGEEQQPRGHDVQSPDVGEPRHVGEEAVDGPPPLRVPAAHYIADRLVEREPGHRPRPYGTPVDRHSLAQRIHAHPDRGHGAVHAHATRTDQILGLAAGRHARTRQGALQAHQRHSGSAGAGGRSATDSSSNRGSSSRSLRPRISRNCGVVP